MLLAWVGYSILEILATDRLVSLPQVSVAYAMSVIPISAVLFVVGQAAGVSRGAARSARRSDARGGVCMIGFLVFVCVVVLVLINVPIAVALCIASVVAMLATQGAASLPNVPLALYQGATSFPLIAIPLFILAAAIMNTSGISHRLIDFCQALRRLDEGRARPGERAEPHVLRGDLGLGGRGRGGHRVRSSCPR